MTQIPESFWQYVAISCLGIVVAILGWVAKTQISSHKDLQDKHQRLNDFVLTNFHPKNDINLLLAEIKESVNSLHKRFDSFLSKGG